MNKHGLKTAAALLAGGVAALDAARRFSRSVPRDNTIVVFETIGRVPGKKRQNVFIGYPVHGIESLDQPTDAPKSKKDIRKGVRQADKWLRSSSKQDGERRKQNRTLGGNRQAVCEFVMVKRSRNAKGKSIGVTQRCFRSSELVDRTVVASETVREEAVSPAQPPIPQDLPDFGPDPAFLGFDRRFR
jgi:hypothetical protein